MEKNKLEEILKEYKTNKSIVETTLARIEAYKNAMNNPNLIANNCYSINNRELGMPGSPLRNINSCVEKIICEKELTTEVIKQWIKEDEWRIFRKKLEVEIVEKSLESLTKQERFIVECKYFEKMNWRDIEFNVNNKFRPQNFISESGLRKINTSILDKLKVILEPIYKVA